MHTCTECLHRTQNATENKQKQMRSIILTVATATTTVPFAISHVLQWRTHFQFPPTERSSIFISELRTIKLHAVMRKNILLDEKWGTATCNQQI